MDMTGTDQARERVAQWVERYTNRGSSAERLSCSLEGAPLNLSDIIAVLGASDAQAALTDLMRGNQLRDPANVREDRLVPALSPDGSEVDHDCVFRRMMRDVAGWLDIEQDDAGRYKMTEIETRIRSLLGTEEKR